MNWLSIVILIIIGGLTFRAYQNGVIREVVSLCALILAIPIAGLLYDDLAGNIAPIFDSARLARLVAFLSLLFGVVIVGQLGAYLLRSVVELLNLGWADRWAGALLGFAKGVLIVQAVLVALVAFPKPDLRDTIDGSPVARGLIDATPTVLALLPDRFGDAIDQFRDGPEPEEQPVTDTPAGG